MPDTKSILNPDVDQFSIMLPGVAFTGSRMSMGFMVLLREGVHSDPAHMMAHIPPGILLNNTFFGSATRGSLCRWIECHVDLWQWEHDVLSGSDPHKARAKAMKQSLATHRYGSSSSAASVAAS